MSRKAMTIAAMLGLLTLLAAPWVMAQQDTGAQNEPTREHVVVATGILQSTGHTVYMYGTHTITDEASNILYALYSDNVDLHAYESQRATVYGTSIPRYENGAIEGGPPLLDITRVDGTLSLPASGPSYAGMVQYGS